MSEVLSGLGKGLLKSAACTAAGIVTTPLFTSNHSLWAYEAVGGVTATFLAVALLTQSTFFPSRADSTDKNTGDRYGLMIGVAANILLSVVGAMQGLDATVLARTPSPPSFEFQP